MGESGDGEQRRFELSFSSEEPVTMPWGREILDHRNECVDLMRLRELGTVLFNHDRNRVIGRIADVRIEGARGLAVIELDTDEFSEQIRQKILSGSLRGVSVGYQVNEWQEVRKGARSTDGRFEGPCSVAVRWWPFEISIVSVPADASVGVGRVLEVGPGHRSAAFCRRVFEYNSNRILAGG